MRVDDNSDQPERQGAQSDVVDHTVLSGGSHDAPFTHSPSTITRREDSDTPVDWPGGRPANLPEDYVISSKPWIRGVQIPTLLFNADIVDPRSSSVIAKQSIHLRAGRIVAIRPTDSKDIHDDLWDGQVKVRKVDCAGMFVCPGLIDCHVHLMAVHGGATYHECISQPPDLGLFRSAALMKGILSNGFTTVRDTGGASLAHSTATEEWLLPGPRVFQCGRALSQTGGHCDFTEIWPQSGKSGVSVLGGCCGAGEGSCSLGRVADGIDECLKATRDNMRRGANHIKVCTSGGLATETDKLDGTQFTVEELKAVSTVCKNMGGTLVTAHCYTNQGIRHAIEGGCRGIEHGNLLDAPTARLMADNKCFLTPTLALYTFNELPPYSHFQTPEGLRKNAMVKEAGSKALAIADEAGVTVCFGTDVNGPALVMQTWEFVIRGTVLPSATVLKHATINAAQQLDKVGELGEIVVGAYADILLLKGNPLEDIGVLDRKEENHMCIMKDGRVVKSRVAELPVEISCEY